MMPMSARSILLCGRSVTDPCDEIFPRSRPAERGDLRIADERAEVSHPSQGLWVAMRCVELGAPTLVGVLAFSNLEAVPQAEVVVDLDNKRNQQLKSGDVCAVMRVLVARVDMRPMKVPVSQIRAVAEIDLIEVVVEVTCLGL